MYLILQEENVGGCVVRFGTDCHGMYELTMHLSNESPPNAPSLANLIERWGLCPLTSDTPEENATRIPVAPRVSAQEVLSRIPEAQTLADRMPGGSSIILLLGKQRYDVVPTVQFALPNWADRYAAVEVAFCDDSTREYDPELRLGLLQTRCAECGLVLDD